MLVGGLLGAARLGVPTIQRAVRLSVLLSLALVPAEALRVLKTMLYRA